MANWTGLGMSQLYCPSTPRLLAQDDGRVLHDGRRDVCLLTCVLSATPSQLLKLWSLTAAVSAVVKVMNEIEEEDKGFVTKLPGFIKASRKVEDATLSGRDHMAYVT